MLITRSRKNVIAVEFFLCRKIDGVPVDFYAVHPAVVIIFLTDIIRVGQAVFCKDADIYDVLVAVMTDENKDAEGESSRHDPVKFLFSLLRYSPKAIMITAIRNASPYLIKGAMKNHTAIFPQMAV